MPLYRIMCGLCSSSDSSRARVRLHVRNASTVAYATLLRVLVACHLSQTMGKGVVAEIFKVIIESTAVATVDVMLFLCGSCWKTIQLHRVSGGTLFVASHFLNNVQIRSCLRGVGGWAFLSMRQAQGIHREGVVGCVIERVRTACDAHLDTTENVGA